MYADDCENYTTNVNETNLILEEEQTINAFHKLHGVV
jgi:hypothetical protein